MKRKKHGKNRKECRSYMRHSERNKCINTLEEQKEKRECRIWEVREEIVGRVKGGRLENVP